VWSRRAFLRAGGALGTAAAFAGRATDLEAIAAATQARTGRPAEEIAADEEYWREVQLAFTLDRTLINLNNGHHSPQPRIVQDAVRRYLELENQAPVYYANLINGRAEMTRRRLAAEFGCEPEELAITRNASESLQILQNGIDLKPGDEVITTDQDYPRMLTTWDQRMRRDKIKVSRLQFPVPTTLQDLYERFERAITPQTRVLHFCHITNMTGQLFPVQRICRLARSRGITTIVDGAHAGAQFPFKLRELECDGYGVSLHKWLLAPLGTGILFVRRDQIARFWPLQAAPARADNDIRKFEEVGTMPAAPKAGINEALAFHQAIGAERKAARLRYLTLRWANRLKANPRVRILSNLDPGHTWGLATFGVEGMDAAKLSAFLMDKYRIITATLGRQEFPGQQVDYSGLRITPNIYTTLEEIDTFCAAVEEAIAHGV